MYTHKPRKFTWRIRTLQAQTDHINSDKTGTHHCIWCCKETGINLKKGIFGRHGNSEMCTVLRVRCVTVPWLTERRDYAKMPSQLPAAVSSWGGCQDQQMQLTGIVTHISAAPKMPARCTVKRQEVSKTDLAGMKQFSGSVAVTQKLGTTLILNMGTVRSSAGLLVPPGCMLSLRFW